MTTQTTIGESALPELIAFETVQCYERSERQNELLWPQTISLSIANLDSLQRDCARRIPKYDIYAFHFRRMTVPPNPTACREDDGGPPGRQIATSICCGCSNEFDGRFSTCSGCPTTFVDFPSSYCSCQAVYPGFCDSN
jgi:hypothetical protein